MNVVAAMPAPANAKPMSIAAGRQRIPHGDTTRPSRAMGTRNAGDYTGPFSGPHDTSQGATSVARIGVASMASKLRAYLNLKKKLNVVSNTDPFIAATASSPGATNLS